MKERPIIFSGEMVRAILDGRKTQTRRILKPQPDGGVWCHPTQGPMNGRDQALVCRHGQPGDRLWVRETFQGPLVSEDEMRDDPTWAKDLSVYRDPSHCVYRATGDSCEFFDAQEDEVVARWKPSIHMPRWASRITLEITAVRVERLQDISEMDARREGLHVEDHDWRESEFYLPNVAYRSSPSAGVRYSSPRHAFEELWKSINGPDSWEANPWVWVVEFRRIES